LAGKKLCKAFALPSTRRTCAGTHLVLEPAATLPMPLQLAIYRLAQELAQNVLKHAQGTEATLEVEALPGWVVLRVEDNGCSFDPIRASDGLGLRSLRGRVALLGGQVYLTTAPRRAPSFSFTFH
jgi:signal transduction histidine kinase